MLKNLEHHEHAEHMAHGHGHGDHGGQGHDENPDTRRNQMAALLVAVLAAGLAMTEQGARRAEIRVQENAIFATDAWAQYQAKSTRGTFSKDISELVGVMGGADPDLVARRTKLRERLAQDQERFEKDPKDGKEVIAGRAKEFEHIRDHSLEQTHAFHNGAACMELGIVLSTASAIIKSKLLIFMALGFGIIGAVFSVLGVLHPELGASVFGLFESGVG